MRGPVRSRFTYSNVMATMAVFIALGGVSYAVGKGSIGSREIQNNAVRGVDVRDGDLTVEDFAAGQVPTGARGATGPQGVIGQEGATGPGGSAGSRGATGQDGSQGATGPQGTTGNQGPAGFSGTDVVSQAVSTPPSTTEVDTISCPGTHPDVTGGGYEITPGFENVAFVMDTRPTADGNGWAVKMRNGGIAAVLPYSIWAVCVQ